MRRFRRFLARLANFAAGRRADARLREEMDAHIAQQTEDNLRAGLPAVEARRQALLKFGPAGSVQEDYHGELSLPFLETLLIDLRYAFRQLAAAPGFALVSIITIALGVGATTAIYSVIDAVLINSLPYPKPEQLVRIETGFRGLGAKDVFMSVPEWKDYQRSGIFEYVSPERSGSVNLTGSSRPARVDFKSVAAGYFALLDVKPELGRVFAADDPAPGFNLEIVISHGLWQRLFGGDPNIIGRTLRLDNDAYHVVGVLPAGFHDQGRTPGQRNTEIWAASGFSALPSPPPARSTRRLRTAIARLKPGLTIAGAQARLDALTAALRQEFPRDYPPESNWTVTLVPLGESVVGDVRQPLLMMMGAVAMVLLIGCVNVANLLLARATARARQMAIRQALGAPRMRLIRQLLTESLLLSLLGGIAGIAVLYGTGNLLLRAIPAALPRMNDIAIQWPALLFALAVSCLTGALFGLAPALQAAGVDPGNALRREGRGSKGSKSQTWTLKTLVVTEFALSLVLLIAAGLLLRSFQDLLRTRLGFEAENRMSVKVWLPFPNDPSTDVYGTAAQETNLLQEMLRRCAAIPGVREVAVGSQTALPISQLKTFYPFELEQKSTRSNLAHQVLGSSVSPGYFHLLGIALTEGRAFNDFDTDRTQLVAVVNEAFAKTWWPGEDPVGKRIRVGRASGSSTAGSPWVVVVGVVADARMESVEEEKIPQIYLSSWQAGDKDVAVFLQGNLDPAKIPEQARAAIQSIDAELPVFGAERLPDTVSDSLAQRRFGMEMLLLFAVTALLLSALGVYGTISYMVNERTRDIGIRIALGARKEGILRMVLFDGLQMAGVGAAVGLAGAWAAARLMSGLVYGISPYDPVTFIGLTVIMITVALAACYIPARRAMRVDPILALRES